MQEVHRYINNNGGIENFSFRVIDQVNKIKIDQLEVFWIKNLHTHFSEGGLNQNWGGGGVSDETRLKISLSNKGRTAPNKGKPSLRKGIPLSEETKEKISISNKGKKVSEETRIKLSESHIGQIPWIKGKKHSEESKKKMSSSLKGRKVWNKGKPHSEETKKKISISNTGKVSPFKGKKHSEKTREKICLAIKGKKTKIFHTDETKLKLSNNNKKLSFTDVKYIKIYYLEWGLTLQELAPIFGVHFSTIQRIIKNKRLYAKGAI